MAHYRLVGRELSSFDEAFHIYMSFLAVSLTPDVDLNASIHCASLDGLKSIVAGTAVAQCSVFGWRAIVPEHLAADPVAKYVRRVEVACNSAALHVGESYGLPDYDWDGSSGRLANLTLTLTHIGRMLSAEAEEKHNAQVSSRVSAAVSIATGNYNVVPHVCASMREDRTNYMYVVPISRDVIPEAFAAMAREFRLPAAPAALELVGSVHEIDTMLRDGHCQISTYPPGMENLNMFGTPFAIEPDGLRFPVSNCSIKDAQMIGQRAWASKAIVPLCSLVQHYIAWPLRQGGNTRRTWGNMCQLIMERGRLSIQVGVEQYAGQDPPVREVSPILREVARAHGADLRAVPSFV